MDSNDELRRYWCERLGWQFVQHPSRCYEVFPPWNDQVLRSDADLAEAVREWYQREWNTSMRPFRAHDRVARSIPIIERAWLVDGPLAFLAAVKEVVDGQ